MPANWPLVAAMPTATPTISALSLACAVTDCAVTAAPSIAASCLLPTPWPTKVMPADPPELPAIATPTAICMEP